MGEGLIAIPSAVLVQQYFTKHRALAVALSSQGFSMGTTITGPLSRLLIDVYAWRGAMLLSACVAIQGFVCAAAMRPVPQKIVSSFNATPTNTEGVTLQGKLPKSSLAEEYTRDTQKCSNSCQSCSIIGMLKPFDLSMWKSLDFVLMLLSRGMATPALSVMIMYAVPRAAFLGIDKLQASTLPFALGICSIMGRFIAGFVTNNQCTDRMWYYTAWQFIAAGFIGSSILAGDQLYLLIAVYGAYGISCGKSCIIDSPLAIPISSKCIKYIKPNLQQMDNMYTEKKFSCSHVLLGAV